MQNATPLDDPELRRVTMTFIRATAEQMKARELLRRIDTKFVVPAALVLPLLGELRPHYAGLPVADGIVATYRNLYFDTDELICFHDHRRGRRIRHRVRIRHYPERNLSYLEVKTKRNDTVTDKARIKLIPGQETLGPAERAFLASTCRFDISSLRPVLRVDFLRLSLLGIADEERVTVDLRVCFDWETRHRQVAAAVIEVKQPSYRSQSPIMQALRLQRVREQSLSKFSTGMALLYGLRCGRLLPDLRNLARIEKDEP